MKKANRGREDQRREKKEEETHHEISAKQTKTVRKVSIGSQKIVNIGLSTGSLETGQQKEKSPEILAREAVAVLATLSTSAKQKGK